MASVRLVWLINQPGFVCWSEYGRRLSCAFDYWYRNRHCDNRDCGNRHCDNRHERLSRPVVSHLVLQLADFLRATDVGLSRVDLGLCSQARAMLVGPGCLS